jgi:GT2 family glycosyltransferase
MITLCIPTLNRYDLLHTAIKAAEQGSARPDKYHIIDNGGTLKLDLDESILEKVQLEVPGHNLGVAASWNRFLRENNDYVIISNDDIQLGKEAIKCFVNAARENPEQPFFCVDSPGLNAWSLFLERTWSLQTIGEYDETFWPAYFEDNDRYRRYTLADYKVHHVPGIEYEHVGSATLSAYTPEQRHMHHEYFQRNQTYYITKWGDLPGMERNTTPFGI